MLICGTSAVVYPFAQLPRIAKDKGSGKGGRNEWGFQAGGGSGVTIIEVNAEATPLTREGVSDYIILGKTGDILPKLVEKVRRMRG
jgi:NAD-dependent SIR2 family protein deacetylase